MRVAPIAALMLAVAQAASAQVPAVTPAGDPSVRSDTLYRLAVNAADYPNENDVWLLDDGIVVIDSVGRMKRTYRQVTQVLNDRGVQAWSQRTFSYRPDRERLVLNWAKTVNPDGSSAGDSVTTRQASAGPGPRDMGGILARHHGLKPGMIVDQSWTVEAREPPTHPDFHLAWRVTTDRFTRRSRYIVAVPQNVPLNIVEHNLQSRRNERVVNGMRVHTWSAKDVSRREAEPFTDLATDGTQRIHIAGTLTWHDVALLFGRAFDSATVAGPNVRQLRDSITAGARTLDDSLARLKAWVRTNLRPSTTFQPSVGYDLRQADAIAATRSGDRVDALVLFAALARAAGWLAHPVLGPAGPGFDERAPSIAQLFLTHIAIEQGQRRFDFVAVDDGPVTLFLAIPQPVFIPLGGGQVARMVVPALPRGRVTALIDGTVKPDGAFEARSVAQYVHAPAVVSYRERQRASGRTEPNEAARVHPAAPFAARLGRPLGFDSVQARLNADSTELTVEATFRQTAFVESAGGPGVLPVLPPDMTSFTIQSLMLAAATPSRGARRSGIRLVLPADYRQEIRVSLPEGWRATLPADVDAQGRFGRVIARATQQDTVLHIVREITAPPARYGPEMGAEFEQWLAEARRALYTHVIVQRP